MKIELFVYDRCGVNEAHKAEKFTHLKLERKQFNISAKVFQNSTEDSKNLNQPLTPFSEKIKIKAEKQTQTGNKAGWKKESSKIKLQKSQKWKIVERKWVLGEKKNLGNLNVLE